MRTLLGLILICCSGISYSGLKITSLYDIRNNQYLITEIDLSNKGLIEFPMEILECYNLKKLNLSNNGLLRIPIELSKLSQLEDLDLSSNQGLSAYDLDTIFAVSKFKLDRLNLADCGFYNISSNLGQQRNLRFLDISNNELRNFPPNLMLLAHLEDLDISSNKLFDISWIASYWWKLRNIDASGNPYLNNTKLLRTLSFFDRLNSVELSGVNEFPPQFRLMNVKELIIKNSNIQNFPRTDLSTKINRIQFENCTFKNPERMVELINENVKPEFVSFKEMDAKYLVKFLEMDVDSVALSDVGEVDLNYLIPAENLKWIDLRSTSILTTSIRNFVMARPDVELVQSERINSDVGTKPPIDKFIPKPIERKIMAESALKVQIGKTKFDIPKETFMNADGSIYEGEVSLEYTEYMTPMEIMLSGITMTTEVDGEPMMLSSGGMFTLNAFDDKGAELSMNPTKVIDVQMISSSTNPDMVLWELGDNGSWQLAGKDEIVEPFKVDQAKLDSIMGMNWEQIAQVQTNYFADRYLPKIKWLRKENTFEITFSKYRTNFDKLKIFEGEKKIEVLNPNFSTDYLCRHTLVYDGVNALQVHDELKTLIKDSRKKYKSMRTKSRLMDIQLLNTRMYEPEGPNFFRRVRILPDYTNDRYNLTFYYKAEKMKLPVTLKSAQTHPSRALKENERFYKDYTRMLRKSIKTKRKNKIKINAFFKKNEAQIKYEARWDEYRRQEQIWKERVFMDGYVGRGSVSRIFKMRGFGTFNCDAVARMESPYTIDKVFYDLESDRSFTAKGSKIIYIDEDRNGVLTYEPDEKVVIDKAVKSTLVVMISATIVGIYKSVRDRITGRGTEVHILDISEMNNEEFMKALNDE